MDYDFSSSEEEYEDEADTDLPQTQVTKQQLNVAPFNMITAIVADHHTYTTKVTGTGAFIGPDLVLTDAHNFYDVATKKQYSNFRLYYKANELDKQQYIVKSWRYPPSYKDMTKNESKKKISVAHDYALLKLQKRVQLNHYFSLAYNFFNQEEGVSIYGYPSFIKNAKKQLMGKMTGYQGEKEKSILSIDTENKVLKYILPAKTGQSGSPIFYNSIIVALHKAGVRPKNSIIPTFNAGRLITQDMIQNIKKWAAEMKGQLKCSFIDYTKSMSIQYADLLKKNAGAEEVSKLYVQPENIKKEFPYSCIGVIKTVVSKKMPILQGNGFLISNNLVLTSSSNIFTQYFLRNSGLSIYQLKKLIKIQFCLGDKNYQVQQFQFNTQIANILTSSIKNLLTSIKFDFCLLKLKKQIKLQKYLNLMVNFNDCSQSVKLIGYPKCNGFKQINQAEWGGPMEELEISREKKMITYKVKTQQGMAGSPIICNECVIGYHKCSMMKLDPCRGARLITGDMLTKLYKWNQILKGAPFTAIYYSNYQSQSFLIQHHDHYEQLSYIHKKKE